MMDRETLEGLGMRRRVLRRVLLFFSWFLS